MAANPFTGLITPELKQLFSDGMNYLFSEEGATTPCRLIYATSSKVVCPNCNLNPVTGKSGGVYNGTGPTPFSNTRCPVCNGQGIKEVPVTEVIYMMVIWDVKKFSPPIIIEGDDVYVQTWCNISLMPKLKRTKEIVVNTRVEDYVRHTFSKASEPQLCGCCISEDAFISTLWKRSG